MNITEISYLHLKKKKNKQYMLKKILRKLGKGIKLLFKIVKAKSSFYLFILLILMLFLPTIQTNQNLNDNLLESLLVTFALLVIDTVITYPKFSRLEGIYDSYLYDEDDKKKLNTNIPIGVYDVEYGGGYKISIKKTKSLELGHEKHLWEGKAEIPDVEIGTLYWQYISPSEYKDFVGYKKIVIPDKKNEEIKIYMFGEEGIVNKREVLIKRSE